MAIFNVNAGTGGKSEEVTQSKKSKKIKMRVNVVDEDKHNLRCYDVFFIGKDSSHYTELKLSQNDFVRDNGFSKTYPCVVTGDKIILNIATNNGGPAMFEVEIPDLIQQEATILNAEFWIYAQDVICYLDEAIINSEGKIRLLETYEIGRFDLPSFK